jgi:hypothetical protein
MKRSSQSEDDEPHTRNGAEKRPRMPGLLVFETLTDAIRAGYQVYDTTPTEYFVRVNTCGRWALAIALRHADDEP